jgi:hypothetical protein
MNSPVKPAKYYICMDTETQRESCQNLMNNIKHKTGMNRGIILEEALANYLNLLSAKGGKG